MQEGSPCFPHRLFSLTAAAFGPPFLVVFPGAPPLNFRFLPLASRRPPPDPAPFFRFVAALFWPAATLVAAVLAAAPAAAAFAASAAAAASARWNTCGHTARGDQGHLVLRERIITP